MHASSHSALSTEVLIKFILLSQLVSLPIIPFQYDEQAVRCNESLAPCNHVRPLTFCGCAAFGSLGNGRGVI